MKTAIFQGPYGGEERVTIRKARAGWAMHAPGWRNMHFQSPEQAAEKAAKHHGFIRIE